MKHLIASLAMALLISVSFASEDPVLTMTQKIADLARTGDAYSNLRELVSIGARVSGSKEAEQAVEWAVAKLKAYGFDRVWTQPVLVPKWERGSVETLEVIDALMPVAPFKIAALGGSVGTPENGIQAEVIEVQSLEEVDRLGDAVRGKIVFYDRAMDSSLEDKFEAYSDAVDQRVSGAAKAARYGAVGTLVRSLTTVTDDDSPHTGILRYDLNGKIPAAAISTHDASRLSSLLKQNAHVHVRMELSAKSFSSVRSSNVIAEIRGRDLPNEIVVVGGHLDSWDLGVGAQDDGAGVAQSIEVLRALSKLSDRPRRTVRVVLFMSEEFGGVGAREYARVARQSNEKHVAAIESDRGAFASLGFQVEGSKESLSTMQSWSSYLRPTRADKITNGSSGTDVEPLDSLCPTIGYIPESKDYFVYHHSKHDQLSAVKEEDLVQGAAGMAVLTYLLAELGL